MKTEATRTLLFGIFVAAGRRLTAAQVIRLARPLGISASNVKSHLTRMVADGALRRSGLRRAMVYWSSPDQARVVKGIEARLAQPPRQPWDNRWLLLTLRMPAHRAQRERLRAMLWFDGFRPWLANSFLRPAWPQPWAQERSREVLARIPGVCVCGTLLGRLDLGRVRAAYGLDALDREARRLARAIEAIKIPFGSAAQAFAARLRVGGLVARLMGHDPHLPAALWGRRTGMRDLIRAFGRFDARIAPRARRFVAAALIGESGAMRRMVAASRSG